jgi:hypothetical protein
MADRPSGFVSLLAALVIAVTGLIPVVWLLTTPSAAPADTAVATTTTTSSEVPSTTLASTVPELQVDELDPSVVRVLQANGYAELAPESDVATDLPPAVTRVLIDHGAVLTVVEGDPNTGG